MWEASHLIGATDKDDIRIRRSTNHLEKEEQK